MTASPKADACAPPRVVLDDHPHWLALYQRAWQLAQANVSTALPPGWLPQLACMPQMATTWVWDSCFMAMYARYGNGCVPVMNNLDNFYRLQRDDGYISMAYHHEDAAPAYGERINPPLFAWVEATYWQVTGDDSRIARVLPHLVRLFDWIQQNRRRANGLYWFEDAGSSGMDNSPRSGYAAQAQNGSDVCHIDLIAQQALAARSIVMLATHLGQSQAASRFAAEHDAIRAKVDALHWNERTGFYYDCFNRTAPGARANHLNHKTVASFWVLVAGLCNDEQAQRMIEHLTSPQAFWTPHPVATLSRDDPNYDPAGGYWRGGVWAPTNYMVVQGLEHYGRHDLARELVARHLDCMAQVMAQPGYDSIWECYAPELPQPATNSRDKLCRDRFVGWSGLGPIAMLIETRLGIRCRDGGRRVHWRMHEPGRHGIENLQFDGHAITLISSGVGSGETSGGIEIQVVCSRPMTLDLEIPAWGQTRTLSVDPGAHEFMIRPA